MKRPKARTVFIAGSIILIALAYSSYYLAQQRLEKEVTKHGGTLVKSNIRVCVSYFSPISCTKDSKAYKVIYEKDGAKHTAHVLIRRWPRKNVWEEVN